MSIFGRKLGERADFEGDKKKLKAAFRNCELALVVMRQRLALTPEALRSTDTVIVEVAGRARRALLGDDPH
jgi:hypothetical protein